MSFVVTTMQLVLTEGATENWFQVGEYILKERSFSEDSNRNPDCISADASDSDDENYSAI